MPDALQTALTRLGRSRYMVFIDWTNDQTFTNNVWTRVKSQHSLLIQQTRKQKILGTSIVTMM